MRAPLAAPGLVRWCPRREAEHRPTRRPDLGERHKTHQQRRITLDDDTLQLLREHRTRCESRAASLGVTLDGDAFIFSWAPDSSTHLLPDSVTYRYGLLARRLGIKTSLHKLRHYSATELITAGVDIRTVAAGWATAVAASQRSASTPPGSQSPTSALPATSRPGCRRTRP